MRNHQIKRRKRVTPLYVTQNAEETQGTRVGKHGVIRRSRMGKGSSRTHMNWVAKISLAAAVVLIALFSAKSLGLLNVTLGEVNPAVSESDYAVIPEDTQTSSAVSAPLTSSPENSESTVPNGENGGSSVYVPENSPPSQNENNVVLPPAESGSPAYMNLYPDLAVQKTDYIEHDPDDKVIYLTFDDGPCKTTPRLLDVLDSLEVKATFFVTAQFAKGQDLIDGIKEIDRRGHKVAVHSYTHAYKDIYRSVDSFLQDYKKMDDVIVEATGKRSGIYRFPGGSNAVYNAGIRNDVIKEMNRRGFVYHDWSAHNGDSEGYAADAQVERTLRETSERTKNVILMHNMPGKDSVIDVLPQIVGQLKERGCRFDVINETVKPFQFATVE
ncbi:polysaccharide deacetylase family protein [Scatolibacter rhodanostii]|uniref:polysaccharide deacetylase family protein n=1 Tax=Scatolibacter rhodanostii TaxID=2014781 RepID=UPI000C07099B|nr:polysaccharide deacetylase family protein [Scatolibacter rhodanostii]